VLAAKRAADYSRAWLSAQRRRGNVVPTDSPRIIVLVETQNGHGWRYYKAYVANRLEGAWAPLAATKEKAFASMKNTRPVGKRWTDNISHGELLRDGYDQHLEVDPARLRFLIQGVLDRDRQGKSYVQIPWRLGMLEPLE
jgi:hypothetical protein